MVESSQGTIYRDEFQGQDNSRWELDISDWLITYKLALEGWSINKDNQIEQSKRPMMNSSGSTALIGLLLHYMSHHHIITGGTLKETEIRKSAKQAAFAVLEHLMYHYNEYELHIGDIQPITLGVQNMISMVLKRGMKDNNIKYPEFEPQMVQPTPMKGSGGTYPI